MGGVRIAQIRSVPAPTPRGGEPDIEIELHNPGGWYVGGLYWVLWVGDAFAAEGSCGAGPSGKPSGGACFRFSMEQWKKFKQRDPLILTWGEDEERRDKTLPFAKLNKKLLDQKSSRK